MIDFTNKILSEEKILRYLVSTACQKAKRGIDTIQCAEKASDEIIMGILIPSIKRFDRSHTKCFDKK